METGVETAIRIEPRHGLAARAVDCGEVAADDHFAIRLQRDRMNHPVRTWARIETAVPAAIGIEPGVAPNEDLAIRLQRERKACGGRIEAAVQTAIGIETAQPVPVRAVDGGDKTGDEHLPIRLQRDRRNTPVRSCPGIETVVQTPVHIEPGNPAAVRAVETGEAATDKHFPIRLDYDRIDPAVRPCAGIETAVQTPIGIEPGNPIATRALRAFPKIM